MRRSGRPRDDGDVPITTHLDFLKLTIEPSRISRCPLLQFGFAACGQGCTRHHRQLGSCRALVIKPNRASAAAGRASAGRYFCSSAAVNDRSSDRRCVMSTAGLTRRDRARFQRGSWLRPGVLHNHRFGTKRGAPTFLVQGNLWGGQAHKHIEGELPCSR
jgi:hypothetical protein